MVKSADEKQRILPGIPGCFSRTDRVPYHKQYFKKYQAESEGIR
jgi:hypothetical protein